MTSEREFLTFAHTLYFTPFPRHNISIENQQVGNQQNQKNQVPERFFNVLYVY